jgi:hypothetical protein
VIEPDLPGYRRSTPQPEDRRLRRIMEADERTRFREDYTKWLGGEKIRQLKFLHNTSVDANLPDGTTRRGWLVAAWIPDLEPFYIVQCQDGSGDIQCAESSLQLAKG